MGVSFGLDTPPAIGRYLTGGVSHGSDNYREWGISELISIMRFGYHAIGRQYSPFHHYVLSRKKYASPVFSFPDIQFRTSSQFPRYSVGRHYSVSRLYSVCRNIQFRNSIQFPTLFSRSPIFRFLPQFAFRQYAIFHYSVSRCYSLFRPYSLFRRYSVWWRSINLGDGGLEFRIPHATEHAFTMGVGVGGGGNIPPHTHPPGTVTLVGSFGR